MDNLPVGTEFSGIGADTLTKLPRIRPPRGPLPMRQAYAADRRGKNHAVYASNRMLTLDIDSLQNGS